MTGQLDVRVTTPDKEMAKTIARDLLQQRLAASVQIQGPMESSYWWNGRQMEEEEFMLLIKTREDLWELVVSTIRQHHSYQLPEILGFPIAYSEPAYSDWINRSVKGVGVHKELGSSGIKISPVVMGLWQAGKQYWTGIDDGETIRAIQAAYDHGVTAFDTAEEYGEGHSEAVLGEALRDIRDDVVIMTKVFSNHLSYDQVIASCEASLKRLKTDYIDLYQIHWPSGSWESDHVPVKETLRAMSRLKREGKIRAIGVSNFSRAQLEEASEFARIDSVQPPYSLFWRHVEKDIQSWCIENGASILAYSPLAQGILTGKFGPDHHFEEGDHRRANKLFQPENWEDVQEALRKLQPIADRNHMSMAQMSLAWLMTRPRTCVIAGARNVEQAVNNAETMRHKLPESDLIEIDAIGRTIANQFINDPVPWTWNP